VNSEDGEMGYISDSCKSSCAVIPNWPLWIHRGPQLANLLSHRSGLTFDGASTSILAAETLMTVVDTTYWSQHVAELSDALN
jgi:hypothetical protein